MFRDDADLSVDYAAIRRHTRFLIDRGMVRGRAVLLTTGAAGDFTTLTTDERIRIAAEVIEETDGALPIAVGAQTTSTRELVQLAREAERLGVTYLQVSPPYYFQHTAADLYEHVSAAADAADLGIILYNTYWTSSGLTPDSLDRLVSIPHVIGLKWSAPDTGFMEFEQIVTHFAERVPIIDNQMRFVTSYMLGARAIEVHVCNYWPEWGLRMVCLLEQGQWAEAQRELVDVAMPFMQLWAEMEQYTSGDGYLDKLCMELVGLGSSRCRPPTRDVRDLYRDHARKMLLEIGVPGVISKDGASSREALREKPQLRAPGRGGQ
jgi:dihydrodipicolinate synthase/N-acetylneuraminate lyase